MTIDRTTIIQGPALVIHQSTTFWSKGDVILRPVQKRFPIELAAYGRLEERNVDLRIEVSFEPAGHFSDELAAILWPYGGSYPGESVFGATDETLVIHGRDGTKVTLANARVTKMPNLRFGTGKTTIGSLTFTALVAKSADPAAIASYWAWASATYPGDAGFDLATIWTAPNISVWGDAAGFDSFDTETGWEIAFGLRLAEVAVDGIGTVDMKLVGVDCTATATPIGPTAAQALAALHGALAPGSRPLVKQLNIAPLIEGAPEFVMPGAMMTAADAGWGTGRKRVGQCTWTGVRTFAEAVVGPPAVPVTMNPLFGILEYEE
jgi:hypothetical protein